LGTQGIEKSIAELRFFLAAIKAKEDELSGLIRQFKRQMQQAVTYAIRESSLDTSLAAMSKVQERLDEAVVTRGHLTVIRERTEADLQALDLTRQVEKAKKELASLKEGQPAAIDADKADRKIEELERFIQEASLRAGEAITGKKP